MLGTWFKIAKYTEHLYSWVIILHHTALLIDLEYYQEQVS